MSQNSPTLVEQKKVAALQERQEALNQEIQQLDLVLQAKRLAHSQQSQKLKSETDTLLNQREQAFTDQARTLDERLDVKKAELEAIQLKIDEHTAKEGVLLKKISDLQHELAHSRQAMLVLNAEQEQVQGKVVTLTAEERRLRHLNDSATDESTQLTERVASIQAQVGVLQTTKTDIEAEIATKEASLQESIEKYERRKSQLVHEATDAKNIYDTYAKKTETLRRDLATRQLALDAKDKNLKVREYRVNIDEQKIQNNAGLLNL